MPQAATLFSARAQRKQNCWRGAQEPGVSTGDESGVAGGVLLGGLGVAAAGVPAAVLALDAAMKTLSLAVTMFCEVV